MRAGWDGDYMPTCQPSHLSARRFSLVPAVVGQVDLVMVPVHEGMGGCGGQVAYEFVRFAVVPPSWGQSHVTFVGAVQ